MDTTTILIFALAIVAIVALGQCVRGEVTERSIRIHTVAEGSRNEAGEKKSS